MCKKFVNCECRDVVVYCKELPFIVESWHWRKFDVVLAETANVGC